MNDGLTMDSWTNAEPCDKTAEAASLALAAKEPSSAETEERVCASWTDDDADGASSETSTMEEAADPKLVANVAISSVTDEAR